MSAAAQNAARHEEGGIVCDRTLTVSHRPCHAGPVRVSMRLLLCQLSDLGKKLLRIKYCYSLDRQSRAVV